MESGIVKEKKERETQEPWLWGALRQMFKTKSLWTLKHLEWDLLEITCAHITLGRSWVTSGHVFHVGLGPLDLTWRVRKANRAGRRSWLSHLTSDATCSVFVVSQAWGWSLWGKACSCWLVEGALEICAIIDHFEPNHEKLANAGLCRHIDLLTNLICTVGNLRVPTRHGVSTQKKKKSAVSSAVFKKRAEFWEHFYWEPFILRLPSYLTDSFLPFFLF